MVKKLEEGRDIGKLEEGDQARVVALDLVLDQCQESDEQVCSSQASESDESLLADANPWRVADAKEDGLVDVSVDELMGELMTYVIVFLAVLGKESGRGRHCENGNESVIFREECSNEPKLRT